MNDTWQNHITPEAYEVLLNNGYDPEALPSGISGHKRTWRGAHNTLLRCHVCELDGILVDYHITSDITYGPGCIHCDFGWDDE